MRDQFYKFMPIVFGLALGWLLFHPPAVLESLGVLAYGVNLLLCGLLLLSVVALVILANLPAEIRLEPVPDSQLHSELSVLAERFRRLGFQPAGPPWRVNVAPPATLLGFVHESEPVYGTAFRTDTVPPKVSYDLVSILDHGEGGLTTNADPGGAVLPEGDGGLRQVFPGESVEALFRRHLDSVGYLRQQGLRMREVSAGAFAHEFTTALGRQRSLFLSSPLRSSLVTLWRSATKRVPFVGPVRDQAVARRQIAALRTS